MFEEIKTKRPDLMSIESKILDSSNQLMCFKFFDDIDEIHKLIAGANLKNLEEYIGKSKEDLEKIKPGICDEYNSLVLELKDPNLKYERFKEIMDEAWKVTRIARNN